MDKGNGKLNKDQSTLSNTLLGKKLFDIDTFPLPGKCLRQDGLFQLSEIK